MVKSWRTKNEIKKIYPKMGFLRAKQGLRDIFGFKTKNWSHLWEEQKREGGKEEKRRKKNKGRRG